MNKEFYAAERAIEAAEKADPGLLEKIQRDHEARHGSPGHGADGTQDKASGEPAWPKLKPEALYGCAGDIVRAIDSYTEADPVATLTNLLAGFGNVVGPGPHSKVLADEHPARLGFIQVGETGGGRKGTAKSVVVKIFKAVDQAWRYKAGGLSSGEGLVWELRDKIIERQPIKKNGRVADYEEVETDPGIPDKRLFIVEPEFATVLKIAERQGNALSGILRQAWDGDDLSPITKNNRITATKPHLTIVGHVTREELLRYLTETERGNGFANRFIFVLVKRSKIIPDPKPIPDTILNPFIARLRQAFESARVIGEMQRTPEAQREWAAVYEMLSERKPGMFGAIIGRAEAQVLRLSVAYTLLDSSPVIRPEHQRAALALWDYSEESARIIFGDSTGNPVADTILRALRDEGELDRTRIAALFGRNQAADRIGAALMLLEKARMAYSEQIKTGGRAREIWRACNTKKTN